MHGRLPLGKVAVCVQFHLPHDTLVEADDECLIAVVVGKAHSTLPISWFSVRRSVSDQSW